MTSRDIILANLDHRDPARPGLSFDGGRANDLLIRGVGCPPSWTPRRWVEGKQEFYDDIWGNVWVRMVGGCEKGEIHTPFLSSWDKLDQLEIPDFADLRLYETMTRDFADCQDMFKVAHIGGWIFDNARYLRKMDQYFMDMVTSEEELRRLHAVIGATYEAKIHGAGKAGADAVFIGEDLGTQQGLLFSPDMFRTYFKEDYTRLMSIAHGYGMKVLLHSCGFNWDLLDDLIDAGVNCFQFDQPAVYDMPALAEKFRQRGVALWSPVDIQQVMPTGDRAYIEEQARYMMETFKGSLIVKNYPDLHGIGVKEEWDTWAYNEVLRACGIDAP